MPYYKAFKSLLQNYLNSLKLERPKLLGDQIRDRVRELVSSGKLAPGEKIPSSRKLATAWGAHPSTIDVALAGLEKEGLLIRYHGKGTFVHEREQRLTCVGVYCTANVKASPYSHAVRETLSRELHEAGIEMDLWMDPRPVEQYGEPWKPLLKAAEQRQFQAFIGAETNLPLVKWQSKLPVPTAFLAAPTSVPNNVDADMRQFIEISLRELARQGCRSVGLIAPLFASDARIPDDFPTASDMLSHFTEITGELGLIVKNDWMRTVRGPFQHYAEAQERFGYEQFLKLWSQPEKPEGLLIFTDVVARGAITAIREKQVRVPEDLKLALHKNESIDLFCPMPATFVVSSERETARALIEQVQKQFRGESCEPISLPYRRVAHE